MTGVPKYSSYIPIIIVASLPVWSRGELVIRITAGFKNTQYTVPEGTSGDLKHTHMCKQFFKEAKRYSSHDILSTSPPYFFN